MTFGHLTHTCVGQHRVGRARRPIRLLAGRRSPSTGDLTTPSRFDRVTGVTSGAPPRIGESTIMRTTAKATVSHYRPGLLGADHQWKIGGQVERGEHHAARRHSDRHAVRRQQRPAVPVHLERSVQCRRAFDHGLGVRQRRHHHRGSADDQRRAALRPQPRHQSGPARARCCRGTKPTRSFRGLGTLYTWNIVSPRLGVT